ncbi:AAA family ATPase [Mycobacteroides salmoniphilum]|uniref:nucleotide-binding protein n=1 Tax=Mycobacteroides salmoniphilum TaxID=404941 RepID=UPI0010647086
MARPPWLPPPEKERRWSLSGLGSKKKDQREPGRDREAPQVVDLDEDDDRVAEASAAAVPETTTVEDVEADGVTASADVDEPVSQPRRTVTDDSVAVPPPAASQSEVPTEADTPWEMKVPAWGEVAEPAALSSALDRVDDIEVPGIGDGSVAVPSVSEPVVPEQVDTPWEIKIPAWGEVSEPAALSPALDRVDDIEVPGMGDDSVEDRPGAAEVDSGQTGDAVVEPEPEPEPEFVVPEPVSERVDMPWEPEVPEISSAVEVVPVPVEEVVSAWDVPAPLAESGSIEPKPVAAEIESSADTPELDEPVGPPVRVQVDDAVVEPEPEPEPPGFVVPEPVSERVDMSWEPRVPEVSSAVEVAPAPVEEVVSAWHPPAPLVESESIEPEPVAAEIESSADTPELDEPVGPPVRVQVDDAVVEPEPEPEPVSERVDTPWEPVVPEISSALEAAPAPVEDVVAAWHPPAPLAESESIEPEPVAAESVSSADAPELDEVEMRAAALLEAVARARESAADSVAEPATEADGLSQLDEPPTQAADSDVPEAEPSGDVPAVDEIDQRAAALLAAMEAKRSQSAASESDSTEQAPAPASEPERDDEPAPDLSFDHPTELDEVHDLPSPPDFDSGEVETDEPSEVDANSATGSDAVAQGLSEHHETAQGYPEHIDEDSPDADAEDVQSQRPPTRRLALPPWQLPGAATSVEFERFGPHKPSSFDDDGPFSRLRREHADKAAPSKPPAEPLGESPEAVVRDAPQPPMQDPRLPPPPPPPGWRPPQPPPPGWRPPQPPPPGWRPPQPPPPPPGWVAHQPSPDAGHPGPPGPPPQEHRAAPPANYRPPQAFRVPTPLEEAELTGQHPNAPQSGWRRRVRMATGGHVNPGLSRRDRLRQELEEQIRQPIVGDFRIAVLSIKGGVGKTTTTLGLGSALAMVRHDRVIAVDANPDRGTLAERVRDESTQSTVRDLLSDPNLHSYADVRNHTLMATSRLEILASEQEPAVSEVFSEGDYRRTVEILRHYYNIILTDCGTGIMHSAMAGVLDLAHTIVLVSAPAMDAARSASATLDWLMQHGYSGLVRGAHVVLSTSRPGSANLKIDKLYEHFESRCRSVHTIPFDPHLSEGADIDFGLLRQQTMDAYLDLAASVSEDFGRLRGPAERP